VYAFVKDQWVQCLSEQHADFEGRSEREIALASAEFRQLKRRTRQKFDLNAVELAKFLRTQASRAVAHQHLRDQEAARIRDVDPVVVAAERAPVPDALDPAPPEARPRRPVGVPTRPRKTLGRF
jgi:hypothetical protein